MAAAIGCLDAELAVRKLAGSGYPDRLLILKHENFRCCFELKATAAWKDNDSNRRVLTSSTKKLCKAIETGELSVAPCHLLATVLYDDPDGVVRKVRLDFVQPNSLVDVRYEASTSHKLLTSADHPKRDIH
jgi:hypothetical protein